MPTWSRLPHPALRAYVGAYTGYREELDPRLVHHGVPSASVTLIWSFETPLDVGWLAAADETGSQRLWSMISGLHLAPALIRPDGYQCGIQVALTPEGCRRLFGLPAAAIAGEIIDMDVAAPKLGRSLHGRLADARTWAERFSLLDEALLRPLSDRSTITDPDIDRAWHLLAGPDRPRITAVAREIGRSPRWLSSRFGAEYGLSPIEAVRLHRFTQALELARTGRPLAYVAAVTGYADQAHLSREWKLLSGFTPTELLRSAYRFLQDDASDPPAG